MNFKKLVFGSVNRDVDDKLFLACQDGLESLFDQAMREGADPNACDVVTQQRPLHVAVANGKTSIVRKLLSNPAVEPNLADGGWYTPVEIARSKGYNGIEALLVGIAPNGDAPEEPKKNGRQSSNQTAAFRSLRK